MTFRNVLADHLDAGANSFNLVRLLAALSVLISHSFTIALGVGTPEPLGTSTPYTLGQHAVNVFFVISGLMLARSLDRNPSLLHFGVARFLRIFPGLLVFGIVFAFLLGPILTSLPLSAYLSDAYTYLYPLSVLFQFNGAIPPEGVFDATPQGPLVNEPLWTIKYELVAYVGLAGLFVTGLLRTKRAAVIVLAAAVVAFVAVEIVARHGPDGHTIIHQLVRYWLCFMIGVTAFHLRSSIPVSPVFLPLTLLAAYLLDGTVLESPAYFLLSAHLTFVLAAFDFGPLTRWTRRDDISYGTYIYGWPLQQTFISLAPGLGILGLGLLSVAIVPVAGLLSWRYVEAPALKLKDSWIATAMWPYRAGK